MNLRCIQVIGVGLTLACVAGPTPAQEGELTPTNQLHYPLNPTLAGMLDSAERARKAGKWKQAATLYRNVIDEDHAKQTAGYQLAFVDSQRTPGARSPRRRFKGITQLAIEGLRSLPPEGKRAFRAAYDYRAQAEFERALEAEHPFRAMALCYELYPIATNAPRVLETMAERSLESGRLDRAKRLLERLLRHHADELDEPLWIQEKLLLCSIGSGEASAVRELAEELGAAQQAGAGQPSDQGPQVLLGGKLLPVTELVARALEVQAVRNGQRHGETPSLAQPRGDAAHRASFDQPVSVGAARFRPLRFARPQVHNGTSRSDMKIYMPSRPTNPARHQGVVSRGNLFLALADRIMAYDLNSGESAPPIRSVTQTYNDPNPKVLFSASLHQDVVLASLVQDVRKDQSFRGIPIKVQIPIRKLVAFDSGRWRWLWSHDTVLSKTEQANWSFPTAPVVHEGVMYTSAFSIEGWINCYVAAYDVSTGEPIWATWIASGQVEQTMFGEQATEPLCVPVAAANGVIYWSTSFGCVTAVDADTGRPIWVAEYDQIEVRAPQGYYASPRVIIWENNPPVVESGTVVVAPMDSNSFYGFDVETGEAWRQPQRASGVNADMKYIQGASDGRVVMAGGNLVKCFDVETGKLLWKGRLVGKVVTGRGFVAQDTVFVPCEDQIKVFSLSSGKPLATIDAEVTGNLAVCGEHIIALRADGHLAVYQNRGFREYKQR